MMNPLSSISTVYSMIIHEECQRDISHPSTINHNAIAMDFSSYQMLLIDCFSTKIQIH